MQSPQSSQHAKRLRRGRERKKDAEGKVIEISVKPGQHRHVCVGLMVGRAGPKPVNWQMLPHYEGFAFSYKSSTCEKQIFYLVSLLTVLLCGCFFSCAYQHH